VQVFDIAWDPVSDQRLVMCGVKVIKVLSLLFFYLQKIRFMLLLDIYKILNYFLILLCIRFRMLFKM